MYWKSNVNKLINYVLVHELKKLRCKNAKFHLCIFRNFLIISPWKGTGPFIWTNLNPLHPNMLCAKFGWNWLSGSEEEDENVKSLWQICQLTTTTTTTTTDNGQVWSEKLTWAFGSGELKRGRITFFNFF